jgi:hypothetical protein
MFSDKTMAKIKAKKVFTPGSRKDRSSPGAGRPRIKAAIERKKYKRLQYPQDKMDAAIRLVKDKTMTLGEASRHFGIPKTTIFDRIHSGKPKLQLGRPPELTEAEEDILVQRLKVMGMWGFPITSHDLRHLIKSYLDSIGRSISRNVSIIIPFPSQFLKPISHVVNRSIGKAALETMLILLQFT